MTRLFDLSYWFAVMPGDLNILFWRSLMFFSVAVIVASILLLFVVQKYRKVHDGLRKLLWTRYVIWGFTFASITLLLAFFRYQNAYLLSMRALIFIWLAFSTAWVLRIVVYHIWKFPKRLRARDEKVFFDQYLPHKKK